MAAIESLIKWFADPSHWSGPDGIPTRLLEHIQISAESVAIGALIALPIGIVLGHYGRMGNLAINLSNVGRALPSFGILVIAFQIFGLGALPIILSLTALAIPLVMAGIRTSAVQVVATATLAALIAGGGFGRYIIDGLAQFDYSKLFAGAVLVALLALATEVSLAGLERLLTPRGFDL